MGLRILHIFQPLIKLFPKVQKSSRIINNREKILYTAITLFIYLVCCQIPLYGILRSEGSDPFYWMRVILASNKGTLMQLGLSPIISAGWILQLLIGTGIITANLHNPLDRELFEGAQKILAMVLAFGEAFAIVWSGSYGTLQQIGAGNAILIIIQLTASGFIVILLDELLQEGYGLGSGVSLFIAVNICQAIVWRSLSPITIRTQYGTQFQGSIVALIHLLITKPNKMSAIYQAFSRASSPNLSSLLSTILIFFLIIYLQGFRKQLKLVHKKFRGYQQIYPIKLFYTSSISVIFQTTLVSNLYFVSQFMYKKYKGSWWIDFVGVWQQVNGGSIPVSGLAYWISPPQDMSTFITQPLHSIVYTVFVMISCAFFSRFWLEVTRQSPKDIDKMFKEKSLVITGYRDSSNLQVLNRLIPTAAALGGMCIGLISIISDLLGVIGSGTGILITVSIIYGYYEKLVKEQRNNTKQDVM